jgi:hypothetical protein
MAQLGGLRRKPRADETRTLRRLDACAQMDLTPVASFEAAGVFL